MKLWRSTDGAAPAAVAAPEAAEEYELSAIDLYLSSGHRHGWVATNGQRTSDWLNATDPLPVRALVAVESAESEVTPTTADPGDADVTSVPADDILFVIPPPLPPNRHLRLHRRRVHVDLRIGDVTIGGQAHIRPGAEVGEHIFRGRRFVPLTDVELLFNDDSPAWQLPVLIINSSVVGEIRGAKDKQATMPADDGSAVEPTELTAAATPILAELPSASQPPSPPAPPSTPEPASPPAPASEVLSGRKMILLTALELLLAEGVIDIVEFQTKRAGLIAK